MTADMFVPGAGAASQLASTLQALLQLTIPKRGMSTVEQAAPVAEKPEQFGRTYVQSRTPFTGRIEFVFAKERRFTFTPNLIQALKDSSEKAKTEAKVRKQKRRVDKLDDTTRVQEYSKPGVLGLFGIKDRVERVSEQETKDEYDLEVAKLENLGRLLKAKKVKCRCNIPIAIKYELAEIQGIDDYLADQPQNKDWHIKAREMWGADTSLTKPKTPPDYPVSRYIFTKVEAGMGSGIKNSLGEPIRVKVDITPQTDVDGFGRMLHISWKAECDGMTFGKGFEHTGATRAIIQLGVPKSAFGKKIQVQELHPDEEFILEDEGAFRILRPWGAKIPTTAIEDNEAFEDMVERANSTGDATELAAYLHKLNLERNQT
jgi:hypothetical protein